MPIYEYRCKSCGRVFEVIQKFSDKPKRKCESCAGSLEKLISRSAFQLKGGGWYAQAYGKGGTSTPSSSSPSSSSSSPTSPPSPTKSEGTADDASPKKAAAGSCGAGCGCH